MMSRHVQLVAALAAALAASTWAGAQELITNGNFDKNADGWLNQVQGIAGVQSEWSRDAGRNASGGIHLRSEKGGEQATWIWRYVIKEMPTDKALRVSGWVKGKGVESLAAICVQGWDEERKKIVAFATTASTKPLTGDFDWTRIETWFTRSAETRQVSRAHFHQRQRRGLVRRRFR